MGNGGYNEKVNSYMSSILISFLKIKEFESFFKIRRKGNLSRRIDNLTQLGIKYKKRITPAVLPNVVSDETKEIDEN